MIEAHSNGEADLLTDVLSYKLPLTATYFTDRKSVSFFASGSNEYSTAGTKLIKLAINGDGWMDPSTFRICFDVQNTDLASAALLRPLSGGWSFFRRLRILSGGTILEDISEFNRCQELFTILVNKNSKVNIDAEGFGAPAWDYTTDTTTALTALANFPGIKGGQTQTVIFTPLSGILSQPKFLPLKYCNLVFELELVSDNKLPFVLNDVLPFTSTNTSNSWKIMNVQAKVDVCTLDNNLENGFIAHLLSGKSLNVNYSSYISSFQSILSGTTGQQKVRINISRSLSRLKSVFITLDKANTTASAVYKDFNSFYSPMMTTDNNAILGATGEIEFQLQLANKLYPEYPIRSHAEAFYQLRKTLGIQSSALHSFNISAQEYKRRKFVLAIDTETLLSMAFTGKNTKSGELLNIRLDNLGTDTANYAHGIYTILHADSIMEISDSGIRVSD